MPPGRPATPAARRIGRRLAAGHHGPPAPLGLAWGQGCRATERHLRSTATRSALLRDGERSCPRRRCPPGRPLCPDLSPIDSRPTTKIKVRGEVPLAVRILAEGPVRGYFDSSSILQRVHRERIVALSGPRALLMQAAHPLAVSGLLAHTTALDTPYERLARAAEMLRTVAF